MESTARRIAEDLLSIRAVFFRPDEPFTWASGIKSPVYCDNRLILTAPDVRTEVETALMQTIRREYPDAEVLMGTSTAGIAHAAITAQMMGLPMSPIAAAPSSASMTAWVSTSASEWPSRPFSNGMRTPPRIRDRPSTSRWTS